VLKTAQDMMSSSEHMIWDKRTKILKFEVPCIAFPFLWTYSSSPAFCCINVFKESWGI